MLSVRSRAMHAQPGGRAVCCVPTTAWLQRLLVETQRTAAPGPVLCCPRLSAADAFKHTHERLGCVRHDPYGELVERNPAAKPPLWMCTWLFCSLQAIA